MNWKKPFFTSIVTLTFIAVLAMGCNQEPPTSPQPSGPDLTDTPQQVTYVGDDSCKACHTESYENATHSKHYDAFKPLADFPLEEPVGEITIFDPSKKDNPPSTRLIFQMLKSMGSCKIVMLLPMYQQLPADLRIKPTVSELLRKQTTNGQLNLQKKKTLTMMVRMIGLRKVIIVETVIHRALNMRPLIMVYPANPVMALVKST